MTDSDQSSIVQILQSDHGSIGELLADPALSGHTDQGAVLREQLVMELVRHYVAVEQYLFPAVRANVSGGAALADAAFASDRAGEKRLVGLEDDDLTAEGLSALLADVRTAFAGHVADEEKLFSAVVAACTPEQLAELGDDALGAELLAPTRPRSIAPESAVVNKATSLVEGFIDQVRDHYSKRGVDPAAEPSD